MAKKRKSGVGRNSRPTAPSRRTAARARDRAATISAIALVAVLISTGLLVDSGADSAFDAPKRLMTLLGVAVAALAAFGSCRWRNPLAPGNPGISSGSRALLFLAAAALAGAVLAALLSPRRALALDATRTLFLYALLLPLGASRVLERRKTLLLTVFLGVSAVNAVVSLLQARGLYQPFQLQTLGNRESTGAFVGNVGYLALALALCAVASLAILLTDRRPGVRIAAGLGVLLFVGGLLVNRNLTSLTALVAGVILLSLSRFGRRSLLPLVALLIVLGIAASRYGPIRQRAVEAIAAVRHRDWDRLVTYRFGAWATALEMVRERPWIGWGPGTFGAEFVPHRLKAEISARRRFLNPLVTSSYTEAHCDYLQPFAEAGIPTGLATLAAVLLLFRDLKRSGLEAPEPARKEAIFLLAFLGAGAAAALTWFPLQRAISAVPLLLAAGRAWRVSSDRTRETPP